jgi:hypothetical protein
MKAMKLRKQFLTVLAIVPLMLFGCSSSEESSSSDTSSESDTSSQSDSSSNCDHDNAEVQAECERAEQMMN